MNIYLVGFMGAGKTTVGKKFAHHIGYEFLDLDHAFEVAVGMTIPAYFTAFGETAFREKERDILHGLASNINRVVATGGGLPCFFDNMEWMCEDGITVYIQLSAKALASRLEHASAERPVLQNKKGEELVTFITSKLEEREPYYSKAHVSVNGLGLHPQQLKDAVDNYQCK